METRPKYTLFPTAKFPTPPSSRGVPAPSSPELLVPTSGTLETPADRGSPTPKEPSTPEEVRTPSGVMHAPHPSDSSSSSDLSFHKITTDLACAPPPAPVLRNRPKTVYIHNGIGGRGNYHKMIKEKDNAPNQMLQPAPSSRRQTNSRFLSSLFGSRKRQRSHFSEDEVRPGSGGSGRCGGMTTNLGAAEVMRRKMLGARAEGKRSSSSQRS